MIRSERQFQGFEILALDGTIGHVRDIYFDDAQWAARYLVVETGSWFRRRSVLLPAAQLHESDLVAGALAVEATREQVRESPEIDTARPVSRQHEQRLHEHYRWPYYWAVTPMAGPVVVPGAAPVGGLETPRPVGWTAEAGSEAPRPSIDVEREQPADAHLRSAREVRGYHIRAQDGTIGHLEDFFFDDGTWALRYFAVDTRNWWPGKTVLLPPRLIRSVSWPDRMVVVDLAQHEIKAAPEYEPARGLPPEYAAQLDAYYQRTLHPV